jgi:hypothetical protein
MSILQGGRTVGTWVSDLLMEVVEARPHYVGGRELLISLLFTVADVDKFDAGGTAQIF